MRMSEPPRTGWLIIDAQCAIQSAHCTCMAGAGEVCSHVAAMAFYICFDENWASSCTDRLCVWNAPSSKKVVSPKKMKDVYWGDRIKTQTFNSKFLQFD